MRCRFDLYLPNPPPPPSPPAPPPGYTSAVPILAAASLPQSILTHPVYMTLSQQTPLLPAIFHPRMEESPYSGFEGSVASCHFAWACHHVISSLFSSSCLQSYFRLLPLSLTEHVQCPACSLTFLRPQLSMSDNWLYGFL